MSERTFRDTKGSEWRVLEVRPTYRDRRQGAERRVAHASDPVIERRKGGERRVRPGARLLLGETYQSGWLCFLGVADERERRRIAPIPPGWQAFSDRQLARFVEREPEVQGGTGEARGA